jgi:farnesol dehydrogenase
MKVFLTGATGYIGNRIAHYLVDKGVTVHALVRSKKKNHLLERDGIVLFYGDLTNNDAMIEGMLDCDVVIHSAAFAAIYTKTPQLFTDINVKGSQQVFYAAKKSRVKKMVFISSAGVLGPSNGKPINEESERLLPYFNAYEQTKAEAEQWLLNRSSPVLEVTALNLSRVFGPGQLTEANAGTRLLKQVAEGWKVIPGDGKSIGNYVYIDDVVEACYQAMEKGQSGERYIIGGENLDFNTYFEVAKKYTNAHQKMMHLPVWVILIASRVMQFLANFGVQPAITPSWVKRYMYNWVLDNTKAKQELGIIFTPFEKGVNKTVEWLKQEGKLK